ncbi:MAG: hypothetical protein AAGE65_05695 [Planctomycetota bacterium]
MLAKTHSFFLHGIEPGDCGVELAPAAWLIEEPGSATLRPSF